MLPSCVELRTRRLRDHQKLFTNQSANRQYIHALIGQMCIEEEPTIDAHNMIVCEVANPWLKQMERDVEIAGGTEDGEQTVSDA